ncbi:MAG: hypothetical protein WC343_13865 [Bacilli bacterium]
MRNPARPPLRLTDGAQWECVRCGAAVPHTQIISPRQCPCGSWSYRPLYDPAALAESARRRSQ